MHDSKYLPDIPFKGIESFQYSDRNIFAEREKEKKLLANMILVYKGCLLYGQSGIGKSSLIQAGFIPLIIDHYHPEIIRVRPDRNGTFVISKIKDDDEGNYFPSIFDEFGIKDGKITVSFEEFVKVLINKKMIHDKPPLLLFDQFEELITYFEESGESSSKYELSKAERLQLQKEIMDLLQTLYFDPSIKVKLLFAFREDYLAKFSRLFDRISDLNDQYLRLTSVPIENIRNIISYPFEQDDKLNAPQKKYHTPFDKELIDALNKKFSAYFGENEVALTEVQIVCKVLFTIDDNEKRINAISVENAIANIIEEYYQAVLSDKRIDKELAISVLILLVLNERTRNIFHINAIIRELSFADAKKILDTVEFLESNRLIRKETRKDGSYFEISSETLIPYINRLKKQKEREKEITELAIRNALSQEVIRSKWKFAVKIIAGLLLSFIVVIVLFAMWKEKRKNSEIISMAMLFKGNQLLETGDLKNAFGIFGRLSDDQSTNVRKQIDNLTFQNSDIPGKTIVALTDNSIICQINDTTYELWKIISNDSIQFYKTYGHLELVATAPSQKYFALYANDSLIVYDATKGNDFLVAVTKEKPYFAFSAYSDLFSYRLKNNEYIVDLKNDHKTYDYLLGEDFKKFVNNAFYADDHHVFAYYDDYLIALEANDMDSLLLNVHRTRDAKDALWVHLQADSILYADVNGLKVLHFKSEKEREVQKGNYLNYLSLSKPSQDMLYMYSMKQDEKTRKFFYDKMWFYDLKNHFVFSPLKGNLFHKMSVNKGYSKCLVTDTLGKVFLIDVSNGKFNELNTLSGCAAYDISDDGSKIMFVTKDRKQKDELIEKTKNTLWLYDIANDKRTMITDIYEDGAKDSTSIYGKYYFRFNTTSDKIAYIEDRSDSTFFVVKDVSAKREYYRSSNVVGILDDGNKTDFTKDYVHVKTRDNKEGIILLNGKKRDVAYYRRFYPAIDDATWNKMVEELNLDL